MLRWLFRRRKPVLRLKVYLKPDGHLKLDCSIVLDNPEDQQVYNLLRRTATGLAREAQKMADDNPGLEAAYLKD